MNIYFYEWIERLQPTFSRGRFRVPHFLNAKQNLALQITIINHIEVNNSNRADACRGQIEQHRASQSSRPNDQNFGSL
jgi:hypothetical protein